MRRGEEAERGCGQREAVRGCGQGEAVAVVAAALPRTLNLDWTWDPDCARGDSRPAWYVLP
jgi:hypothetical protein